MKKNYVCAFFLGLSAVTFAQLKPVQSHRSSGDFSISVVKNSRAPRGISSAVGYDKVDYLFENFEGAFPPAGWTVNSGPFSTTTDPDQDWHKEVNGGFPENTIAWSDPATQVAGGCASILYVNSTDTHDENLISPSVTLPNTATRLSFNFATSYYWHVAPFDNADVQFSISTDGGTNWSVLWQEDDQAMLDASESAEWYDGDAYQWFTATFDLSAYQGQNVQFKFNFSGLDGAPFYIDNFVVQDVPANDLKITKAYTHDIFTGYDYTMVPLDQATEITPIVIVKNNGGSASANVPVTVVINDGTTDVYTGSLDVSLAAGDADTLLFSSGITPSSALTYTISFSLPSDDDNSNNNSAALSFSTNADIYAHDSSVDGGVGFDIDDEWSWGCVYEITSTQTLNAANVIFDEGTTTTQVGVFLSRFDATGSVQSMEPIYDFVYNVPPSAINNTGTFQEIAFPVPQVLETGFYYVLEIRKNVGTDRMYLGSSSAGDDDAGTVGFGPFGANDAVNYYTGWNVAMAIRMNFGIVPPSISSSEPDLAGCTGQSMTLTSSYPTGNQWLLNGNPISGETGTTLTVSAAGTYSVSSGGFTSADAVVTFNAVPSVTYNQTLADVCANYADVVLTPGTPAAGVFSGTSVTGAIFDPSIGAGTYSITYSVTQNGCTGSASSSINVLPCLSLGENELANVAIYPNPTTGVFTVTNTENVNAIELVDQLGRTLASWKVNQIVMNLDVTKIAQGNYTLVFKGDNSSTVKQVQIAK